LTKLGRHGLRVTRADVKALYDLQTGFTEGIVTRQKNIADKWTDGKMCLNWVLEGGQEGRMVQITDNARQELLKVLADKGDSPTVRIFARYG
jgi:hypothetical protein